MVEYLDKKLYNKVKKIADEKYKKHSAYKSMYIIEKYEEMGGKLKGKRKNNLNNWTRERWVNLSGVALGKTKLKDAPECGIKDKNQGKNPSICRPSVKVNRDTPKLAQNFSKSQLKKAVNIKKKGKIIKWNDL
tara:strand:- start:2121 stop:2519 length:399 start_codon:yes stop_codon:yes gene_type:complete